MPKYTKADIRHTIRDDEFRHIMKKILIPRDRLFLSLLYCTGARPSEVSGDPQRNVKGMCFDDIEIDNEEGVIIFHVPVSKVQKNVYAVEKRRLVLEYDPADVDLAIRMIINNLSDVISRREKSNDFSPTDQIFTFCRKTGYNIVERAGKMIDKELCPYNFRHSRLTQLSEQGAGIETLMYFKGSRDTKSISNYLHARDIHFHLKKEEMKKTITHK